MTTAKTIRKKAEPPVLLFKEETFEHMGMIATAIGGIVHVIDRSYARSIGIVERNVSTTVEDNRPELETYGTLHVAHAASLGGNDVEMSILAYWLNLDQLMILLMRSSSDRAIEFRRRIINLIKDLREGRLVYRDNALVASEPRQGSAMTPPARLGSDLPFDLSKGLKPVPEVMAWARSFGIGPDPRRPVQPPREVTTDAGVTLRIEDNSLTPIVTDVDVARLVSAAEALAVGDLIKANTSIFEQHGNIRKTTVKNRLMGRLKDMPANLLNLNQVVELLKLLEARGASNSVRDRIIAIFRGYWRGGLADLCSDPTQKANAIALEQARVGYVIDAHGYLHLTHNALGRPLSPYYGILPARIDFNRVVTQFDPNGRPVYLAPPSPLPVLAIAPPKGTDEAAVSTVHRPQPVRASGRQDVAVQSDDEPSASNGFPELIAGAVSAGLAPLVEAILATRPQNDALADEVRALRKDVAKASRRQRAGRR